MRTVPRCVAPDGDNCQPIAPTHRRWAIPVYADVPAKSKMNLLFPLPIKFKPQRLFLFEPEIVRTVPRCVAPERIEVIEERKWWFGKLRERKTVTHLPQIEAIEERVRVSRGEWLFHSMFIGQELQFKSHSSLIGDVFGGDPQFDFDADWCSPGIQITIQIENLRSYFAPLRGVLIGKRGG